MHKDKGLSIFMTKNAEAEPWLTQHAFVAPPDFESFTNFNSSIIYVKTGDGKTALCQALSQYALNQIQCMPVSWSPNLTCNLHGSVTDLAMTHFSNILSACASQTLHRLMIAPQKQQKECLAAGFIPQFLHQFALGEDQKIIKKQFSASKPFSMSKNIDLVTLATQLINGIKNMGFSGGIWIIVDGAAWTSAIEKQTTVDALLAILSTLRLFEIQGFHFKMVLPIELERNFSEILSKDKCRVMISRVSWEKKHLQQMIEKRLRFALQDTEASIAQIYAADDLFTWLTACSGLSPRGWLEYFRPIFATVWEIYQTEGLRMLQKDEWIAARKRSSLQLRFYPDLNQIVVGQNAPQTLSQEEMAIFSYLYKNENQYCTKREIYNKAYLPFNVNKQSKEISAQDDLPKEYDDLVNTAIHRLRKSIEPLPKEPVFITMKKNLGYRLSLQAFYE